MTATRRLAAIAVADVVGYSRLMEADEVGTLAALKQRRTEILEPTVRAHGGRIVKLMGDGVLLEFASAVNAVKSALELQTKFAEANEVLSDNRHIVLRIGINLGDVIGEGSDIYGDGVNIAARLEALAEPGGTCISGQVHEAIQGKLAFKANDLGDIQLKNITRPVRVFRVASGGGPASVPDSSSAAHDKSSIAVLPFVNMSGDPEQEYFADGLTEDIITALSRFKNLFVMSRNSSFHYKGKSPKITDVGRELGVHYILEGSVRKAGNRVRVTAQLIEAKAGDHVWAERYDRDLADVFAVQDEVVHTIAGIIPGQIDRTAVERNKRKPPVNPTAYDCELRGRWALAHWNEGLTVAHEWFERAVAADPSYAVAHACLANTYAYGLFVLGLPPDSALTLAREHAQRATLLDPENPQVNAYAAWAYHLSGDRQSALTHAERAVSLNPNDAKILDTLGAVLSYSGEPERALEWFARSEKLDPYAPDDQRLDALCDCYYLLHRYEKVIEIHRSYQQVPAFLYLILAAAYAQSGKLDEAKASVLKYQDNRPAEHDAATMIKYQVRMCARLEDRDHWLEGYRKAGIDI